MPYVKFDTPKSFADNKGSCAGFINYLTKQDFQQEELSKQFYFNQDSKFIPDYEVINSINSNKKGLTSKASKFYTGSINFSEDELIFIDNDMDKIKAYTIEVMKEYAKQFNRSIDINNLNWFA